MTTHFNKDEIDRWVWLRTCYKNTPGSESDADARHDQLLATVDLNLITNCDCNNNKECLLSDPSLYNYGSPSEWHKIFERLPQLITTQPADRYLQRLKEAKNEAIREVEDDEEVDDDEIYYVLVYTAAVVNWIFIEDEQTLFGDGTLRVVFFRRLRPRV